MNSDILVHLLTVIPLLGVFIYAAYVAGRSIRVQRRRPVLQLVRINQVRTPMTEVSRRRKP